MSVQVAVQAAVQVAAQLVMTALGQLVQQQEALRERTLARPLVAVPVEQGTSLCTASARCPGRLQACQRHPRLPSTHVPSGQSSGP